MPACKKTARRDCGVAKLTSRVDANLTRPQRALPPPAVLGAVLAALGLYAMVMSILYLGVSALGGTLAAAVALATPAAGARSGVANCPATQRPDCAAALRGGSRLHRWTWTQGSRRSCVPTRR